MKYNLIKKFIIGLIFLVSGHYCWSQNIVPNPSFEMFTTCPTQANNGEPLQCTPWFSPTNGSSDYFNACAIPSSNVDVPMNGYGNQNAHTGVAYTGIEAWLSPFLYREYLTVQLTEAMLPNTAYDVSFYVSLADNTCGTDKIGAYFSASPPPNSGMVNIDVDPQLSSNLGIITDKVNWILIEGCIVAQGGEQYITIGNFFNDANTNRDVACGSNVQSYFYIDDVSVIANGTPGTLDVDLGDPVTACGSYTIDPNYPTDFHYHWEDGSINPTLTVTQSGTYAVTISDGCAFGVDSVEVTILPGHTVDIGVPTYLMCQGDTYLISLDPTLGTYTWQDGSHATDYAITTSGLYQVTLDDNCFPTSDFVNVTVVTPPPSNLLGPPDTTLCPGQEIQYVFSPLYNTFHWQNGWSVSSYTIMHPGLYAVTVSSICGVFTDSIQVNYAEPFEVDLGPDPYHLCVGENYEINLDPSLGDPVWQDGSTDNPYTISSPGLYSVTVTNACFSASNSITVVNSVEPVVNLGNDTIVCEPQFPFLLNLSGIPQVSYLWQDGSTLNQFLVTAAGTYSVTVSNSCYDVADSILVTTQTLSPNVILPVNQFLCEGETFVLTNSGDTGNYLWQDNSTADSLLVTTPGIYSLTVSTICGSGNDDVEINYIPPVPVPNLGPDFSLCPGEQITLSPNIQGVQYLWQDHSTSNHYVVSTPGTYYVQISDQCTTNSDTVVVTLNNQPPQLALPSQLSLCQGQNLTLHAGIGGVSYLWSDHSQADTLNVTSAGVYSLTISNSCGTDADSVIVVDGGPAPSVALGNDVSLCSGDTITLTPVFMNANNWIWGNGSVLPTYSITGNEVVTLVASNACGTTSDTLLASILPGTPPINLGADTLLCPGNSLLLNINTPGVNIVWSDGSVNNQLLIQDAGTYYAVISNQCGENADTINIGLLPAAPILNLGIDQSLCPGEIITLDPGVQNASYLWDNGSVSSTYSVTGADTVMLTVTNSCGADADTVVITISTDGPQVNLGPDILACEGEIVTLMSDISGVNYLWQDGSNGHDFSTSSSGTYILQVSNNCGVDADTVNVTINGTIPIADLGPDTSLCNGTSLILSSAAAPGTKILWQDGSSLPTLLVADSGTYILSETNHCGQDIDTVVVTFNADVPDIYLGPDILACEGDVVTLKSDISGVDYLWQDGSTDSVFITTTSGIYILQVSNQCGANSDTVNVDISGTPPNTYLGPDTTLCNGTTLILSSSSSPGTMINWQDGSSLPTMLVDAPGTYSISESNHCGTHADSVLINYLSGPLEFDIGRDTTLCPGESLLLTAPQSNDMIKWQDGSSALSMIADQSQTYSLEISNQCGDVFDAFTLSFDDHIPLVDLQPVYLMCPGDHIELNVTQSFPATYLWNTGATLPLISIDAPGNYSVTVQGLCSEVRDSTEVAPSDTCDTNTEANFFIPNIFSPNGDNINDVFTIKVSDAIELISNAASIYDRWGNLVFQSTAIPVEWKGDFNGSFLNPGVYVYIIKIKYLDKTIEKSIILQGDITLVK